ncbi:VOC family protein [Roseibium sediminicola]|uniref:VOC family protein n=1 Tax=Roseibium sediminicola TaxID=2933272 RepID=A0ABT0GZS5_9HYPH|nr:VOC family protein [Roseibium sp. CAU 1639]MCK7614933.1 VOC family protein [Roseibium sp. CAU 1639]
MNPMETHGAVSWVEHSGPDADKARSFYQDVLDWTVADTEMEQGTYAAIMIEEKPVGGFAPMPGNDGWKLYITVDDVDARVAKAETAGASVVAKPMTVSGVGRMATIEDPFGARLTLIDYSKA